MSEMITKEDCINMLRDKYEYLQNSNENRYPKRSDFSDKEVVAIKAYLGPWPRALEKASIKPVRDDDHMVQVIEKRIRSKRRRTEYKKSKLCERKEE